MLLIAVVATAYLGPGSAWTWSGEFVPTLLAFCRNRARQPNCRQN